MSARARTSWNTIDDESDSPDPSARAASPETSEVEDDQPVGDHGSCRSRSRSRSRTPVPNASSGSGPPPPPAAANTRRLPRFRPGISWWATPMLRAMVASRFGERILNVPTRPMKLASACSGMLSEAIGIEACQFLQYCLVMAGHLLNEACSVIVRCPVLIN